MHGENSIHILNRIIVQTPNYEELVSDVNQCLTHLCCQVAAAVENVPLNTALCDHVQNATTSTDKLNAVTNYKPFKDNSYKQILLAYSLMKYVFDQNNGLTKTINSQIKINLPLLSGFLASFLEIVNRPLSKITFLPPLNQDPSSFSTSKICIESMKKALVDSGFQQEVVIVADEKIYSQCIKVNS